MYQNIKMTDQSTYTTCELLVILGCLLIKHISGYDIPPNTELIMHILLILNPFFGMKKYDWIYEEIWIIYENQNRISKLAEQTDAKMYLKHISLLKQIIIIYELGGVYNGGNIIEYVLIKYYPHISSHILCKCLLFTTTCTTHLVLLLGTELDNQRAHGWAIL